MSRPILEQKLAGIRGNRNLIVVYGYLDTGTSHTVLGCCTCAANFSNDTLLQL